MVGGWCGVQADDVEIARGWWKRCLPSGHVGRPVLQGGGTNAGRCTLHPGVLPCPASAQRHKQTAPQQGCRATHLPFAAPILGFVHQPARADDRVIDARPLQRHLALQFRYDEGQGGGGGAQRVCVSCRLPGCCRLAQHPKTFGPALDTSHTHTHLLLPEQHPEESVEREQGVVAADGGDVDKLLDARLLCRCHEVLGAFTVHLAVRGGGKEGKGQVVPSGGSMQRPGRQRPGRPGGQAGGYSMVAAAGNMRPAATASGQRGSRAATVARSLCRGPGG